MRTLEGMVRSFARAVLAEHAAAVRLADAGRNSQWDTYDRASRSRAACRRLGTRLAMACQEKAFAPIIAWSAEVENQRRSEAAA